MEKKLKEEQEIRDNINNHKYYIICLESVQAMAKGDRIVYGNVSSLLAATHVFLILKIISKYAKRTLTTVQDLAKCTQDPGDELFEEKTSLYYIATRNVLSEEDGSLNLTRILVDTIYENGMLHQQI